MQLVRNAFKVSFLLPLLVLAGLARPAFAGPTILIWSADYGKGHDTASEYFAREIQARQPEANVVILNVREFIKYPIGDISFFLFNKLQTSAPKVYDRFFRSQLNKAMEGGEQKDLPNVWIFDLKKMAAAVEAIAPDAIVDAWPHSAEAWVQLKKTGKFPAATLPAFFFQMTDWVLEKYPPGPDGKPRKGYYAKLASGAITGVPSKRIYDSMIAAGVPPENLIITGIPVEIEQREELTIAQREARRSEALAKVAEFEAKVNPGSTFKTDVNTMFLEGGLNGVGNYPLMAASMALAAGERPLQIIAACGKSKSNYDLLNAFGSKNIFKRAWLYMRLRPLLKEGYTKAQIRKLVREGLPEHVKVFRHGLIDPKDFSMKDLRRAALITVPKPGGLSLVELIADGILTIANASRAAGQEAFNVEELAEMGTIKTVMNEASVGKLVYHLLDDSVAQAELFAAQEKFRKEIAPGLMADRILLEANKVRDVRMAAGSRDHVVPDTEIKRRIEAFKLRMKTRVYGPGEALRKAAVR